MCFTSSAKLLCYTKTAEPMVWKQCCCCRLLVLTHFEYFTPSSVCTLGQHMYCPYTCMIVPLYLLQPVAQFTWARGGMFFNWRWQPAGNVFCFDPNGMQRDSCAPTKPSSCLSLNFTHSLIPFLHHLRVTLLSCYYFFPVSFFYPFYLSFCSSSVFILSFASFSTPACWK